MKARLKGPVYYVPEGSIDGNSGLILADDICDYLTGDEELEWVEDEKLFYVIDDDVAFSPDSPFIEIIND